MANKALLTNEQIGSLRKAGFTELIEDRSTTGNFYGDMAGVDHVDSYVFSGNAGGTRTLLGEFTTEDGYITIFDRFIVPSVRQSGSSEKEALFEVETDAVIARLSVLTTAGPQNQPFPVVKAQPSGVTVQVWATGETGAGVDCSAEIRVLKIAV